MTTIYAITVNNWGWYEPQTYHFETFEEAESFGAKYPAQDNVETLNVDEDEAEELLNRTVALLDNNLI